jgi:hypothetical protein
MRRIKPGTLIKVIFLDIESDPSWQDKTSKDLAKAPVCKYFGVVDHQDQCVLYCSSMLSMGESDLTKIPIGCIVEIWRMDVVGGAPIRRMKNASTSKKR